MKVSTTDSKGSTKEQLSTEEIVESLKSVEDDVKIIVKLSSKEKRLVEEFFDALRSVPQELFSITVTASELPIGKRLATLARINSSGQLILTSEDGQLEVIDLNETKNRNLMMAIVGDITPKFKDFVSQIAEEKLQKRQSIQEMPSSEAFSSINVLKEESVGLVDSDADHVQELPVLSVETKAKIEEVTEETLEYLEMLGNEVFNESPVSVYFDDWLVNLRQVMLGFESNAEIKVDDVFTDECEQIYNDIEEELANRLLKEAEIEASSKTLEEKKYILREMDDEYATQSKYIKVRGKSAIDFLIKNVQRLENELTSIQQIKTLNPIKRIAKEQKRYSVTQKLKTAKQRLALAMQNSAVDKKAEEIEVNYGVLNRDFESKEKSTIEDLIKNVKCLEDELVKIQQIKTLNPIKIIANDKRRVEITEELNAAKEKLALAVQNDAVKQEKIRDEYEKKKETTMQKMQSLEKEIEIKRIDGSLEARREATKALARAVKSLIQRNTAPSQ